jgi:hypothetical protein
MLDYIDFTFLPSIRIKKKFGITIKKELKHLEKFVIFRFGSFEKKTSIKIKIVFLVKKYNKNYNFEK